MLNEEHPIGEIRWVGIETKSSRELGSGTVRPHLRDVYLQRLENEKTGLMLVKSVLLGEEFLLGLSDTPGRQGGGFGFTVTRTGVPSFSWEWFNPVGDGRFVKLQESGELSITTRSSEVGMEIFRLEFLTDISARIMRFGAFPLPIKFHWRVKISAGSFIEWPSLAELASAQEPPRASR